MERASDSVDIGLVADEPIRLEGLISIFDQPAHEGHPQLMPVHGGLDELLGRPSLSYLVVDLHSLPEYSQTLEKIRCERPDIRLIVIGPEKDDALVLNAIVAGARAYLDLTAGPEVVRAAIEVVTEGSIWAPRRLLSQLIDRLLKGDEATSASPAPHLTRREGQVLNLIRQARSNREIAAQLDIEERTVKAYVSKLMRKAGTDNRIKLSLSPLCLSLKQEDEARLRLHEDALHT
jgi:DNA-binding NarL/FixJ family response regulator